MPQRSSKTRRRRTTGNTRTERESPNRRKRKNTAQLPPHRQLPWPLILLATVGLLAAGYYLIKDHGTTQTGTTSGASASADTLLREMQAAYKNLNAYSDTTRIQLHAPMGERWVDESAILRTRYQRPNLLSLTAERPGTDVFIQVASNGEHLRAKISDASVNNFDNQFVQRAAPQTVNVQTLYSATEYADVSRPGELNSLLMKLPAPLQISQLSLLLDDPPLAGLLKTASAKKRLEDARLAGKNCHRVAAVMPDGQFVFWIDPATHLLQRIEFPRPGGADSQGTLICDYTSISTESALRDTFTLPIRKGAKVVRNFVLPPAERVPARLNEQAGDFVFSNLSDQEVSSKSFEGKIVVLCWFDSRPDNQAALAKLQRAFEAMKEATKDDSSKESPFEFLLVANDPATKRSHADIQRLLFEWKITIPVVRDLSAIGRDQFDIIGTPSLIVIDEKGVVQLNETGIDPELESQLPGVLKLIKDGKPVAADFLAFLSERRRAYDQQLAAASLNAPERPALDLPTNIPPATKPEKLKLTQLWEQTELKAPGNVYARIGPDDRVALLVHDGWQHIVELDTNGQVLRRHAVANAREESEATAVRRLKTATDRTGRRYFLAWSTLAQQVTVLDDTWKTVLTYPPKSAGQSDTRVQSADLGDVDGDGEVELYVSFAPPSTATNPSFVGIHSVGLDGRVRWRNEDVEPARSITRSPDKSGTTFLLTTNRSGQIVPIDANGKTQRAINVGSRAIHQLFASDADDPNGVFCGVTFLPTGELLAIALSGDLSDQWDFGLPPGAFRNQIEFTTTANWFEHSPWWVLAGPDGSVSFVSHDGEFHDHFQSGQELTGIATYKTRGANVLLLSGSSGISAWRIEKRTEAP